ncbi:hypothetical protein DPMN_125881 [Dreissena polymorpha]|uniref:Uncharacterized protein n=1 Tax=Dreissena polymorpha TaxID=45954 RepID=A0A9D4GYB8_DREPO|nr:hypothetical protein DPMN_125881 [Dreissena polymorpha]
MLRAFPSKSTPGKLVEYDLWPRYISCRPWRTRAEREQSPRLRERRKRSDDRVDDRVDAPRYDSYDNFPWTNRFSSLEREVDLPEGWV